jgi:hypothetical protein
MPREGADEMGVDDYRDREGDAEERTGLGRATTSARTTRTPAA